MVDLDMDTSILSNTTDLTNSAFDFITFRIPTGGTVPQIQYSLKTLSPALISPLTPVVSTTLRAHSNACIKELLPSLGFDSLRNVFERSHAAGAVWPQNTTFNDQNATCKWFRWGLTPRMDLTGVAWDSEVDYSINIGLDSSGNGVPAGPPPLNPEQTNSQCEISLVSPRHGLAAWHMVKDYFRTPDPPPGGLTLNQNQIDRFKAGAKVRLYDRAANRQEVTIKGQTQVGTSDIAVITFTPDVDPKKFKIYPVLPARTSSGQTINWAGHLGQGGINATSCLVFNREREVGVYQIESINTNARITVDSTTKQLRWPKRATPFSGLQVDWAVSGDSSGPVFMLYRGNPVLVAHNTGGGSHITVVFSTWHQAFFDPINSLMAIPVPGATTSPLYQLTTIPLE
jgi:hypothetical protein